MTRVRVPARERRALATSAHGSRRVLTERARSATILANHHVPPLVGSVTRTPVVPRSPRIAGTPCAHDHPPPCFAPASLLMASRPYINGGSNRVLVRDCGGMRPSTLSGEHVVHESQDAPRFEHVIHDARADPGTWEVRVLRDIRVLSDGAPLVREHGFQPLDAVAASAGEEGRKDAIPVRFREAR
jgi:hypothetical protein